MGGRKSYTLENVVGKTDRNAGARKELLSSVESKEVKNIVSSALNLFSRSDKVVRDLSEAVQALDFVQKNASAPSENYETRRRLAAQYWAKRREETGTPPNSILDRILVDSIAKVIRRGRRK